MPETGFHDVPPGCVAAVVTYLEMDAPPPSSAAAPPPGLSLVHVRNPSSEWYLDLFRAIGGQDWLWSSRLELDRCALAAILADAAVEIRVLRDGAGRDLGLLELDFRTPKQCKLAFFGVARAVQGQGVGRWMMQAALARAWAVPMDRVLVNTCTLDHPAALPFYMRSGFRPVARRVEIGPDPRLAGLLPRDAAPHVPVLV